MEVNNFLVDILHNFDNSRDRSNQVEIGPSAVGGCRRKVWHEMNKHPKVNETSKLAAVMGTFIHAGIAEALKYQDPFGEKFAIEEEFKSEEYNLKGHIDLYLKEEKMVVDWKTKTKSSLRYFPSDNETMQVQLYGFLLEENGYEVRDVTLVAICRDGNENDVRSYSEPYNREKALEGLQWLKSIDPNGEMPEPEKPARWCASYCPYYGENSCLGIMK